MPKSNYVLARTLLDKAGIWELWKDNFQYQNSKLTISIWLNNAQLSSFIDHSLHWSETNEEDFWSALDSIVEEHFTGGFSFEEAIEKIVDIKDEYDIQT